MIQSLIFIIKNKILKDPVNLSHHAKSFLKLSKNSQRIVLDKYFDKLEENFDIENYFNTKESRYYDGNEEISFFNCYYFDKLILEFNIYNIRLIDKFKLSNEKINFLINYSLEMIEEENISLDVNKLLNYQDSLPVRLGKSTYFMNHLIDIDYTNIKYIIYNEFCPVKQRDLINKAIDIAKTKEYNITAFLKQDKTLPDMLIYNLEFITYLIENDATNIKYLKVSFLDKLTTTEKNNLITTIINSTNDNNIIEYIESIPEFSIVLNKHEEFIYHMLNLNINNITYIDWHNLTDNVRENIINYITTYLKDNTLNIDIMSYPFKELFFQNYNFMEYLINLDFRWITINKVNKKEENDKLIDLYFKKIKSKRYKFKLKDFLEDGKYLNSNLIENRKMFHYLFVNNVKLVKHINFFNLKSTKTVVENLVNELEKTTIDYEFNNEDFLIDGKYPIVLSNSYRFMRYIIDKNFNHIAYLDTSMMNKKELTRIINYAFRMVYYIRGKNKTLNFDLNEEYFKNSMIINNDYFNECLKSL